ncbi:endolytic transglycosylase MltG [Rummeliibacillus stabekisii]|uniref:endolytic transglycosylase MltG n=1 Tax=Rummeliibacillus stabekisii TaxID=241244 RepID=UPI0020403419|nr:endolytic transglycosylase MltG [Rummeliibacillus stabekisii]
MEKKKNQDQINKIKERQSEKRVVRKIVLAASGVFIALALVLGISMYFYVNNALKPVDENATKTVKVNLPIGSSIDTISETLENKNIIKNAKVFKYYTKVKNESEFQAGTYNLTSSMTIDEIIKSLKTGKVYRTPIFTITIPEGLTLDQIAEKVEKSTNYSKKEFMDLVNSKKFIKQMKKAYPRTVTKAIDQKDIRYPLEGYLYPSTYPYFEEKPTLQEIIEPMIAQTNEVITNYSGQLKQKHLSVHKFLTFASLLEKEATAKTDRETIASVFYNRLESKMPLQTDPTVLYALGEHKSRVLYKDLEVKNPYNTYKIKGLPPGPISNAGKESLEAAINPATTEYLYFVSDKNGNNHFSKTYDEHLGKVEKFIK